MEPVRAVAAKSVGAQVKEDEDGDELEGKGGECGNREPEIDASD